MKVNTPNLLNRWKLQLLPLFSILSHRLMGLAMAVVLFPTVLPAQEAAEQDEQIYELSPFVVDVTGDIGYLATSTLSGTRFNASLFETPASITVLTKELLNDLNAEVLEEYLQFATSTDRSFGADPTGLSASWTGSIVKTRGFSGVPVTRDYFDFIGISPDRFNVERLDVQKGPNAVLYGVGGPGGVINTTSKRAQLGSNVAEIGLTVGSFSKKRVEADFNVPVIDKKLALRVNGLLEDSENWQKPSRVKNKGIALAGTWRPLEKTEIRIGVEHMERFWNLTNPYPPGSFGASEWLALGAPLVADPLQPQSNPYPGVLQGLSQFQVFFIPQLHDQPFRLSTQGVDLRPDLPGNQPNGHWRTLPGPVAYPSGRVTDLEMVKLLGEDTNYFGPGFTRDDEYTVAQFFLTQQIYGFSVEFAYAHMERYSITHNSLGWNSGIYGDPNPVVPGAYYADGNSDARQGRFPGTPMPYPGKPNPFAGSLYVEDWPGGRDFDNEIDFYRIALGRTIDLTDRSKWLGRHTFAGVWHLDESKATTAPFSLYNTTPNNINPAHAAPNQIFFRTYLDPSPGGIKGMLDPKKYPIPTDTGVTAEYLYRGAWNQRLTRLEGKMGVLQSHFLDNRLVLTAGWRLDRQTLDQAQEGEEFYPGSNILRLKPNTKFLPDGESPFYSFFDGETKTLGAFVKITEWLGLIYNTADAVQPQGQPDIYGDPIGNRKGKGEDFGFRLRLLEDKVYISATYYETTDSNQALTGGPSTLWIPFDQGWNQVFETSVENGIPLPQKMAERNIETFQSRWDRWDLEGKGIELEIVGNLTPQWNVSVNYSKNETVSGDGPGYAPDHTAFMEENRAFYAGNPSPLNTEPLANLRSYIVARDGTPDRDFTANPATFGDVYEFASTVVDSVVKAAGKQPFGHNEESFNFFTTYRFGRDMPIFLDNVRIGFGGNWRSKNVIGYDANNDSKEIWGDSFFIGRLMLAKRFPLKGRRSLEVQLNVNNVFGEEDLLPYGASSPDKVDRYMYQRTRQSWTLKATLKF